MIIELLDGTIYDIENFKLKRLYHRVPSLQIEHNTANVDGRGTIILSSTLDTRTISVDLLFEVEDIFDFYLMRDEVNDIFVNEKEFYIIFKNESYKRYKVKLANGFLIEPHHIIGAFTVEFIMTDKYSESTAITSSRKEWDVDLWAWNGVINWDDDLQYSFNSNSFNVKNLGNVNIDPRESFLEISLKGSFNSKVTITNNTTGDIYEYNGNLTNNDTLLISGVRSLKNNVSVFSNTNKKLITLRKGDNSFSVMGGTVTNISFNFRFLFK